MPISYTQKQSPAQNKCVLTASSVMDNSSQRRLLQRRAGLVNGVVQRVQKGKSFLAQWEIFFEKINHGCSTFVMNLDGVFYKFIVGGEKTSFEKKTMDSYVKEINLSREHLALISSNPIALKQIVLHEIGHSRYTQRGDDEKYISENCRGYYNEVVNDIINEFHSDMYAFSTLLNEVTQNGRIEVNVDQIIESLNLQGRPQNWIGACCGYPPVPESIRMFGNWHARGLYVENDGENKFEERYKIFRDEMTRICGLHKNEIGIGFLVMSMNRYRKKGETDFVNVLSQDGEKHGAIVNLDEKKVRYNGIDYDVSFLVK